MVARSKRLRVLFTSVPSAGHLNPLLPLVGALVAAGHDVTLASGSAAAATAATAGITFLPAGLDEAEIVAQAAATMPDVAPSSRGIAMFGSIAAPALLRDLLGQLDRLRPDLVIHEEGEWGGPVLAAVAGVPAVAHGWGAPLWNPGELQMIDDATAELWRAHDVVPTSPAGLFDHLYLDLTPPLLQTEDAARIRRRQTVRFRPFDSGEPLPDKLDDLGARPLLYVTLGTVPTFNSAPEVLAAVARGVADLAVDAVVAVGTNNDPGTLEPLPANVCAVPFLPQARVLNRCTAAITHGGAGSTLAALAFGLPLLILPRGAPSQQRLAAGCVNAGAAIALDPDEISAQAIRQAVLALLEDPRLRAGAEHIRTSIQRQPDVTAIVNTLEALAGPR